MPCIVGIVIAGQPHDVVPRGSNLQDGFFVDDDRCGRPRTRTESWLLELPTWLYTWRGERWKSELKFAEYVRRLAIRSCVRSSAVSAEGSVRCPGAARTDRDRSAHEARQDRNTFENR